MKEIAILGSNGFIGKYLSSALQDKYKVYPVNRTVVDLTNLKDVYRFFKTHNFNTVINCAGKLNSSIDQFDYTVYNTNISIFENLVATKHLFGKLITFGSGAEFNRKFNIDNKQEIQIEDSFPKDHYGKSKNLIARMSNNIENFYLLRLFGVFSSLEPDYRLFKRILSLDTIRIQNRYFDYFWLEDILPVIEYYINNYTIISCEKDINLVYKQKLTLGEIVNKFIKIHHLKKNIILEPDGLNYTGDGYRLSLLNLQLKGLEYGLEKYL